MGPLTSRGHPVWGFRSELPCPFCPPHLGHLGADRVWEPWGQGSGRRTASPQEEDPESCLLAWKGGLPIKTGSRTHGRARHLALLVGGPWGRRTLCQGQSHPGIVGLSNKLLWEKSGLLLSEKSAPRQPRVGGDWTPPPSPPG